MDSLATSPLPGWPKNAEFEIPGMTAAVVYYKNSKCDFDLTFKKILHSQALLCSGEL